MGNSEENIHVDGGTSRVNFEQPSPEHRNLNFMHQSIPAVPTPHPPGQTPGIRIFLKQTGKCPTVATNELFKCPTVVDFLVFDLISILIKAISGQTKSQISLISQYCFSDHSFCVSTVSFCTP